MGRRQMLLFRTMTAEVSDSNRLAFVHQSVLRDYAVHVVSTSIKCLSVHQEPNIFQELQTIEYTALLEGGTLVSTCHRPTLFCQICQLQKPKLAKSSA